MLFKDYLKQINKYAEEHPETLELEVAVAESFTAAFSGVSKIEGVNKYIQDRDYKKSDLKNIEEVVIIN